MASGWGVAASSTARRAAVERVCQSLQDAGIPATPLPRGTGRGERRRTRDDFPVPTGGTVMVVTNASAWARQVELRLRHPLQYAQKSRGVLSGGGRAGATASPRTVSSCSPLRSGDGALTHRQLRQDALSEEEVALVRQRDMERLQARRAFAARRSACAIHPRLFRPASPMPAAVVGNCRAKYRAEDITTHAQMILLSCPHPRRPWLRCVGGALIQAERCRDQRVLQLRLDKLLTYGLLAELLRAPSARGSNISRWRAISKPPRPRGASC